MLLIWSPEEIKRLVLLSDGGFALIVSCYKQSFETQISKESGICARMAVRVKHPANCWCDIKLFLQELMSLKHIIDQIFVIRTGFIACCPSSISELYSTLADKLFHAFLDLLVLPRIPHVEVLDFSKSYSPFRVLYKTKIAPCEYDFNVGDVSTLIGSRIILFKSLLPT
jgi:hypothetical protein